MKSKIAVLFVAALFLSQNALAGAWDIGPFDNDDALDWVYELEASSDLAAIEDALSAVAKEDSYIEAPTGSAAIAAAEVVAALLGKPYPQLPPEVVAWTKDRSLAKDNQLAEWARQVISAVQDSSRSELAQLWSESGEIFDEWKSSLSALEQRLQ